jgi:hypothetical protein
MYLCHGRKAAVCNMKKTKKIKIMEQCLDSGEKFWVFDFGSQKSHIRIQMLYRLLSLAQRRLGLAYLPQQGRYIPFAAS